MQNLCSHLFLAKCFMAFSIFLCVLNNNHFLQNNSEAFALGDASIINVRCFWIKGWNVYDISPLEKTDNTYIIILKK